MQGIRKIKQLLSPGVGEAREGEEARQPRTLWTQLLLGREEAGEGPGLGAQRQDTGSAGRVQCVSSTFRKMTGGPGRELGRLEHRPDTQRLQVQSPVGAHTRITQ